MYRYWFRLRYGTIKVQGLVSALARDRCEQGEYEKHRSALDTGGYSVSGEWWTWMCYRVCTFWVAFHQSDETTMGVCMDQWVTLFHQEQVLVRIRYSDNTHPCWVYKKLSTVPNKNL